MSTNFQTGIAKEDTGLKAGKTAAENAREKLGGEPDFVLVFSSSEYDYDEVLEGVRQVTEDAELIGASTAGEFTEEDVNTGSVAVGLISSDSKEFFTGLGTGLQESAQKAVQAASEDLPKDLEGYKDYTLINLHDGLAGKGMRSVYASQSFVDYDVSIAGGSAGDDFKMEETDVFVGDKASSDAVGLGLIASDEIINMVVNHGHEPISEPYEVTEVEDNVVKELDGRPAWNVYKEAIRDHAQRIFDIDVDEVEDESEELAKLLTNYEFGLETDDGYKVRWPGPTTTTDGPMSFACKIPEGAKVKVMASPLDEQVNAARDAAKEALYHAGDKEIAGAIVFECCVRSSILGDRFPEAVEAVKEELQVPLVGFETYGEVCVEHEQMSGYHNTTTVVMLIPE